ncbi:hypothetical protein EPO33_00835 [Patescibacteria group bacterium]|nr:MAG: hypothetical protein EPO33_00835 [Patescibacteria group bacterium]
MIYDFKGPYTFSEKVISDWDSDSIGVYYCGYKNADGKLAICYIGRAVAEGGMRGRLLEHLGEDKWSDVTHFGFHRCDTATEAKNHEIAEIVLYKPKYNTVGK